MAKTLTLYEPTMCCSSGVCGPAPDEALVSLQDTIARAKEKGVSTERFQITTHPRKFTENPEVLKLMKERQLNCLPIVALDGQIIKIGSYPTYEELEKLF
jgi:hypothetical protein